MKKTAGKKDKVAVATPAAGAGTENAAPDLRMIPYGLIQPDPGQPRKTFNQEKLEEMAASMREVGVQSPLVVQFIPAKFKIEEPDLHTKEYHVRELVDGVWQHAFQHAEEDQCVTFAGEQNLKDRFQIIFGERRWRAAQLAGLKALPCIVREITDRDRIKLQFIENNQRENVSLLEEGNAFKAALEQRQSADPKFKVEDLAKELGLSRASAYERLKLTRGTVATLEALKAGKISASVAAVLAQIPEPAKQDKLLVEITNEDSWGYPYSVRDVQVMIEDKYVQQLGKAPFKLDDDKVFTPQGWELIPKLPDWANRGSCVDCQRRTGNMVATFPELAARPNVCTHPTCFAAKCKAHWINKAATEKEKGKAVMTETEFRKVKSDYLAGEKFEYTQNRSGTFEQLMGKHKPEPVLVSTAKGLEKWYPKEDAQAAMKKNGVKLHSHRAEATETPEQEKKRKAKEAELKALQEVRDALVMELAPKLAGMLDKLAPAKTFRILVQQSEEGYGDMSEALYRAAKTDQGKVLAAILDDTLTRPVHHTGNWNKEAVDLWKELGIDLMAEEKKRDQAEQPSLPLPAKKDLQQGKLLDVKKNKKPGKKKK